MKYVLVISVFFSSMFISFDATALAKTVKHLPNGMQNIDCPQHMNEINCDNFLAGYADALEDHKIMGLVEQGYWKNDHGDDSDYRAGYEKGWNSK